MFSAIVAIILVMTAAVLTNTLISTEEKTTTQVYSMLTNYQLADAANIARADALQSFNYNFRERLEDYLAVNESGEGMALFTIKSGQENYTFTDVKDTFEKSILLTSSDDNRFGKALEYVARNTILQFKGGTYGKYNVTLNSNDTQEMTSALLNAMNSVLSSKKDFLEVVGCDDDKYPDCPVGTFYFNIPLNELSNEQYEALPRIIVKDLITHEEIKMAILPKTNLKIYIPLRFFKVLMEAKDAANAVKKSHDTLAGYKLGFCDSTCHPNSNPLSTTGVADWQNPCPTYQGDWKVLLSAGALFGVKDYWVGGTMAGQYGLQVYGANEICKAGAETGAFTISNTSLPGFEIPTIALPASSQEGRIEELEGCKYSYLSIVSTPEKFANIISDGVTTNYLYCGRILTTKTEISFLETNPAYIVKGKFASGQANMYRIMIADYSYPTIRTNIIPTVNCKSSTSTCLPA
jgi:hypothetical protein